MGNVTEPLISVVIPARNEEALIAETVRSVLASLAHWQGVGVEALELGERAEVVVVDDASDDGTRAALAPLEGLGVRVVAGERRGAAGARNAGARWARGRLLVFVDADTLVPVEAIERVVAWCARGAGAGLASLEARDGGARARFWWKAWSLVRRLPIARAKAMPAFLFCTREVFERYGPFDESVEIGEEWPIVAELYRREPERFVYARELRCRTSSRRMELQRFGYARVLVRYAWAVAHASGRVGYGDHLRHGRP